MSTVRHASQWLALAVLLAGLMGCYAPSAVVHANIDIAADGSYTLNGKPLPAAELDQALQGLVQTSKLAILDIHASPRAQMGGIQRVTQAAKQAGIRVAFAEEAQRP